MYQNGDLLDLLIYTKTCSVPCFVRFDSTRNAAGRHLNNRPSMRLSHQPSHKSNEISNAIASVAGFYLVTSIISNKNLVILW